MSVAIDVCRDASGLSSRDRGDVMAVLDSRDAKEAPGLLAQVRALVRRHRSLVSRLSSVELLADSISLELVRLEECLNAAAPGVLPLPAARAARRAKADSPRERLRLVAEAGASALEIRPRADGSFEVRVDGGGRFLLPPLLAELLSVLALDGAPPKDAADGLAGWKALDEVAALLAKKTGRRYTSRAVTQAVYRLRCELFKRCGVNPFLVQTNRRHGARFALRRGRAQEAGGD